MYIDLIVLLITEDEFINYTKTSSSMKICCHTNPNKLFNRCSPHKYVYFHCFFFLNIARSLDILKRGYCYCWKSYIKLKRSRSSKTTVTSIYSAIFSSITWLYWYIFKSLIIKVLEDLAVQRTILSDNLTWPPKWPKMG